MFPTDFLRDFDPKLWQAIEKEKQRQEELKRLAKKQRELRYL